MRFNFLSIRQFFASKRVNNSHYPGLVIGLCALFIIYKYILQVFPSTMATTLSEEFGLNGLYAGHLSGIFLYTLVITQTFVGYCLDRYNPARLMIGAMLCCSIGAFSFSMATTIEVALLARALMGIGGAFAAAGYFKMASIFIGPRHFSLISGLLATAVTVGIILGQVPLGWLMERLNWRLLLLIIGSLGGLLALTFSLLVQPNRVDLSRDKPQGVSQVGWPDVKAIVTNPYNWLLTIYHGLAFSPLGIFAGLWGISFLKQGCQIETSTAHLLSAFVFLGFGIGSPVMGYLADRWNQRKPLMMVNGIISLCALSILIYYPYLSSFWIGSLLFLIGFSSGALMLGFTIGKNINSAKASATVVTLLNTGGVAITAITEPLVGQLLDWSRGGEWMGNMHQFNLLHYQYAFSILPVYLLCALVCVLLIKEKDA